MTASFSEQRDALLVRAGLIVLGHVPRGGTVTPEAAWRRVIRFGLQPTVTVDFSTDDHLDEVDRQWLRLAGQLQLLAPDASFLISTSGPGAMDAPWAIVRLGEAFGLARHLAPEPGEPEFVTLARDGHALCGVTSEEYGVWITGIDLA